MPSPAKSTQLTTQPPSRTSQILPVEIWTIILELTIHVPRLFNTARTDLSFAQFRNLGNHLYYGEEAYRASERQRLILRNVCSAWRVWANSRENRYIVTTDTGIPLVAVLNAVRVPLLAMSPKALEIRHEKPSRWQIIDARVHTRSQAICFKRLSLHANKHPLLHRINLSLCPRMKEQSEYIRCLAAFKHLTYLSLDLRTGALGRIRGRGLRVFSQTGDTNPPTCTVTLPNVRVLEFLVDSRVPTPSTFPPSNDPSQAFVLNLPQIEHLYFYGGLPGTRLEFEWLAPLTLRGLKSLTVGVIGTLDIEWSELPNLEEFGCLNFEPKLLEPIPKMHPLQRVWLFGPWSLETFDALTAGLEAGSGTSLQELHLSTMRWDQDGKPFPIPQDKRWGSTVDEEARVRFCDKVDRFGDLYGLKTLDYHGCTRDNPYLPSVTNTAELRV
jgi:hypothetical protein